MKNEKIQAIATEKIRELISMLADVPVFNITSYETAEDSMSEELTTTRIRLNENESLTLMYRRSK